MYACLTPILYCLPHCSTLPGISSNIFTGITELFDLYMLHVYIQFVGNDVGIQLGAGSASTNSLDDGMSVRLRAMLQHIAVGSIGKYRTLLIDSSTTGSKLDRALAMMNPGGINLSDSSGAGSQINPGVGSGGGPRNASHPQAGATTTTGVTALTHSGNLYGLVERFSAANSLLDAARHVSKAAPSLAAAMPESESAVPCSYSERTVAAAEDLRHFLLLRGCRLMLPLSWLPEAVAGVEYQIAEPPSVPASWTQQLVRQLELFGAQIAGAGAEVPADGLNQLWLCAAHEVARTIVDGISRVKKCTLEGRSGMSLDLQAVRHALGRLCPPAAESGALRLVDDYIKAFYIPLQDLPTWAAVHSQYSSKQVLALAGCIAESSGLSKRRDVTAAVARVEEGLKALGLP